MENKEIDQIIKNTLALQGAIAKQVQGKAYAYSRTYENQPLFRDEAGHYYALLKP